MIPHDGNDDKKIRDLLDGSKRILIIGMSRNELKPAGYVPRYLRDVEYDIIPLNPMVDEIDGMKTIKSLSDLREPVDLIDVFRPPEEVENIVNELIKVPHLYKSVWLQEGIYDDSILKIRSLGKDVVWNRCMMKEYKRLK